MVERKLADMDRDYAMTHSADWRMPETDPDITALLARTQAAEAGYVMINSAAPTENGSSEETNANGVEHTPVPENAIAEDSKTVESPAVVPVPAVPVMTAGS